MRGTAEVCHLTLFRFAKIVLPTRLLSPQPTVPCSIADHWARPAIYVGEPASTLETNPHRHFLAALVQVVVSGMRRRSLYFPPQPHGAGALPIQRKGLLIPNLRKATYQLARDAAIRRRRSARR